LIDILFEAERLLSRAKFSTFPLLSLECRSLAFENQTVIGFLHAYDTVDSLVANWRADTETTLGRYALALRRAGDKAWNVYTVFLATGPIAPAVRSSLHSIEEDLSGTRKIARGEIETSDDLREALLPLLPIQNAPMLEAVDVAAEIQSRSRDVPTNGVNAFLAHSRDEEIIAILEAE